MKILVATKGPSLDSPVAKHFGQAPYFLIYDTKRDKVKVIEKPAGGNQHAIIPQADADGVRVFITGNIGPHAYKLISSLNLQVALARNMSAQRAIKKWKNGELKILDGPIVRHVVHDSEHDTELFRAKYPVRKELLVRRFH